MFINTILLPQGRIDLTTETSGYDSVVLVAGGRAPERVWLKTVAKDKKIFCADKGIESCLTDDLNVVLYCGDGDSTANEYLDIIKTKGINTKRYNPFKDDTDLKLLLKEIPKNANLLVSGIFGGRFDHLYANVFTLLEYRKQKKVQVVLADEKEILVLLLGGDSVVFVPELQCEAISLLPLANCSEVSFKGVQWELEYAPLLLSNPYAISNIIIKEKAECFCHQGIIGLYIKFS